MSNDFKTSLIPPGAPIPDPPGAKLLAKIPIFIVGFFLLSYLVYNIYFVFTDMTGWKNVSAVTKEETPAPTPAKITHPLANDSTRCFECHEPSFSEEAVKILPGPFRGDQSCLACHPLKDFARQHRGHQFEPLKNCTLCHSPHNSIEKPLLKETYSVTCTLFPPVPEEK